MTVQTQEQKAICELIVGSKRDPDFGPLILFGAGGVFTEVLEDSAVDLPPLNLLLARRLIEKTRVSRVLKGYRNLPPSNLDQLAEILVRISQLVTDFPEIVELDVNPLLAVKGGFVAVDARLIVEPTEVPAPRHLIIAPYPNQFESDWMLRDGTPVLLRPMKPEDEPLVSDFLGKCSEETIYFRYFKLIKKWTHEMLIRFTQNDYDRELGLMAIGLPPGPESHDGSEPHGNGRGPVQRRICGNRGRPLAGQRSGPQAGGTDHRDRPGAGGETPHRRRPGPEPADAGNGEAPGLFLQKDTEGGTFRVEMALQEAGPRLVSAAEAANG